MAAMETFMRRIGKTSILQGFRFLLPVRHCSVKNNVTGVTTKEKTEQDEEYEENIRLRILEASLPFVQKQGWTKTAIGSGAESLGYPGITHGMFSNSGVDLINYFNVKCNKELISHMKNICQDTSKKIEPKQFIEDAVKTRLQMIVPYVSTWPQALGIMSLPPNVPVALANLLTLVDDICHYSGDKSVDFNWYSRRIAIGGIYKMTELCLIQDKSEQHLETWTFLKRRLDEAFQIQEIIQNSGEVTIMAKDAILATFSTARNILHNQSR